MAKKKAPGGATPPAGKGNDWVAVTLEPRPGRTDAHVVGMLNKAGAKEVEVLAPGFVSAQAVSSSLDDLREVAEVHLKARKQMH